MDTALRVLRRTWPDPTRVSTIIMTSPPSLRTGSLLSRRTRVVALLTMVWASHWGAFAQVAPISARFEPGCTSVKALFVANVPAVSYTWTMSTGATSTAPAPIVEVPFGQALTVTLTTVDAAGESFTYTETYAAREQVDLDSLLIPNVITPNGDGINDVFTPGDGPNLGPCAELSIFDRYGRKVYENLGNDLSWDGRSPAGEACIPAVYVYVLVVNAQEFTGHLTLFR